MSSHCSGFIPQLIVFSEHELIDFVMQFNARSESVKEKASFRRLIPKNRCLVAVEGYGHTLDCYHFYHVQLLHIDLLYLCCA
jgi:putative SOS response-associated peptidase YedK